MSAQDNILVQRNIVCASSGHVELYVHGQLIIVNQFLKKVPPQVPLTPSTIKKYVDRIVKLVDEVRSMEVCGGFDSEDLKPGWATCSLGEIDRNPFNECRFDETFRSFNCKRLV